MFRASQTIDNKLTNTPDTESDANSKPAKNPAHVEDRFLLLKGKVGLTILAWNRPHRHGH